DLVRKAQALEIIALRLDHQADDRAVERLEHALLDQVAVHHGVEKRIMLNIVDVAIDVVVHPAGRDETEIPIGGAQLRQRAIRHGFAVSPAEISSTPSASARRRLAEPGASGRCWLACGAQAESQTISNVARMRPSGSAKRAR